jgi:hypothetical protein
MVYLYQSQLSCELFTDLTSHHKKVSTRAIEHNEIMWAAFMNKIGTEVLDPAMLMFTDETAKDERCNVP